MLMQLQSTMLTSVTTVSKLPVMPLILVVTLMKFPRTMLTSLTTQPKLPPVIPSILVTKLMTLPETHWWKLAKTTLLWSMLTLSDWSAWLYVLVMLLLLPCFSCFCWRCWRCNKCKMKQDLHSYRHTMPWWWYLLLKPTYLCCLNWNLLCV